MFGFSLSELIVVIVVALVVIGPKDLPKMLRKLGQYSGKLRRMASELRAQSGIDDALRSEGLADDIAEIRKLARGELDAVQRIVASDPVAGPRSADPVHHPNNDFYVVRDREYPRDGADSYGALPDNAIVYAEGLPKSKLARQPLYVLGDAEGVLPDLPAEIAEIAEVAEVAEVPAPETPAEETPAEAVGESAPAEAAPIAEVVAAAPAVSVVETEEPPAVVNRPTSEVG